MKKIETIPLQIVPISDQVPEDISNEEAIRKGLATLPKDVEVPIKLNNGEKYAVPSDLALKEILEGRASFYTEEEQKQSQLKEEYGKSPVSAALLGAARGLSFGASDVLGAAIGEGEAIKAIQEFNPVASTIGEIGSLAVPVVGQAAGARLAAKGVQEGALALRAAQAAELTGAPLAAVSRAGKATSTAVEKLLQGTATGKVIAGAAGGAVEGAIGGAGYMVGQAAIQGADTAGEYLSAALEGAETGALLGGLIGGAIEGAPIAKEKATGAVASLREKVAGFNKEVSRKESQAANMLAKNDDPVLLLELSTGNYKLNLEAKKVQQIADEYGLSTYPEQITDDPSIVSTSQKLLRSKGETGLEYRSQLVKDAEKATDIASKAITQEIDDLRVLSPNEKGQFAEVAFVEHFKTKLDPFKKRYDELNELGSRLNVDTSDFFTLFERWAKRNVNEFGGDISKNSKVASFINDMMAVDTMKGVQEVQKKIRKTARDLSVDSDTKIALGHFDNYITDKLENFARPWKGTGPLRKDKAWQAQYQEAKNLLDDWINRKRQVDADYSIAKSELEIVKDIVNIPKDAFKSGDRLLDYFETPGKITPEDLLKKIKDKDATTLEAIKTVPGLERLAKSAQIEEFLKSVQPGRGKKGMITSAGNDYVDLLALNDKWSVMTKEQKNFLFTPKQQKDIQSVIEWNNAFKRNKVTPQKYLTESLGDTLVKAEDQTLSTIAGTIGGGAIGGGSVGSIVTGVIGGFVGRKITQTIQNITEARQLNKIKGFIGETQEQLSKQAGIIGTVRKSEAKTKTKIKEAVSSLIDKFPENRARLIKGVQPIIFGNQPDKTKESLQKTYKDTVKELEEIRGNEPGYLDEALKEIGPNQTIMPDVASSYAAQQLKIKQYQLANMPVNPFGQSNSPIAKMWQPSDIEMRQFLLVKRASENPLSVIEDIKNGLVNPVSISTLRDLYPAIYGQVTKEIQENLLGTEKMIGEDQKAILAIVLGGNFDESFNPQFAATISSQSVAPAAAQSSPPIQNQQKMKQSGILKMKMADNEKTQTERVLTRT